MVRRLHVARRRAAVIIELKDWVTRGDQPGSYEGLIKRQGAQELHPSDQVRGYTEYCRRFHSAVADHPGGHPKSPTCGHPKLPHLE